MIYFHTKSVAPSIFNKNIYFLHSYIMGVVKSAYVESLKIKLNYETIKFGINVKSPDTKK